VKRFTKILLAIVACLIPMTNLSTTSAQAATTNPLTPAQEAAAKPILQKAFPGITDAQITTLVRDPAFVLRASQITQVSVTKLPSAPTAESTSTLVAAATTYCKYAWAKVKGRGLFGTLFSYKTQLNWCYDGNRVYYQSHSLTPDVTTYGATFGWAYKGTWQALNKHYYTWNGHRYGGYVVEAFPEFARCLGGNIGCIDQRFGDVGVFGHYDGTYTARYRLN
jgi:hypothetical protein